MIPTATPAPLTVEQQTAALIAETRTLLRSRPASVSLGAIDRATGISKQWLSGFLVGKSSNVRIGRVTQLNQYLKTL